MDQKKLQTIARTKKHSLDLLEYYKPRRAIKNTTIRRDSMKKLALILALFSFEIAEAKRCKKDDASCQVKKEKKHCKQKDMNCKKVKHKGKKHHSAAKHMGKKHGEKRGSNKHRREVMNNAAAEAQARKMNKNASHLKKNKNAKNAAKGAKAQSIRMSYFGKKKTKEGEGK